MKRLVSIFLAVLICFSLVSCGNKKEPLTVDEKHYNYGIAVIDIIDQYFDFKITADEAYSRLEEMSSRFPERETEDEEYPNNYNVVGCVNIAISTFDLLSDDLSSSLIEQDEDRLKKCRNIIASCCGVSEIE
jgi:hypothetical protein